MSEAAGATSRLLVVADQLLEKLLDHNLQFSQQTGAGQIVDDLMTEIRRLSAELESVRKDAERWAHACKGNNKQINVCAWDNDAYEFVGYGMKKEAIDAIADAEIAAMKGTP